MKITYSNIEGLVILEPRIFEDDRGFFFESYNEKILNDVLPNLSFVQENQSCSKKNVLRGLHFQIPPHAQAKLVRVLYGKVLDVVVDLRSDSKTYGESFSIELSAENNKQLYIPRGFAHGFLSLIDDTIFSYKCDEFYAKEAERSIIWNDSTLKIDWDIVNPILSAKDVSDAEEFIRFDSPFTN
ncbi:MAG: dTDP-4-dehydrorhamnose 3,5-epimerase [Patiriisocius sp.]|jgi:dTDP-4-dehydrorhamnose 3,5-epimerase